MSVARQIKLFSNFKRKSTKLLTTRQQIINISQEYERIGEQKNNDINHKLSNENIILKKFDINEYDTYISNTDYSLNKESSKYEDFYSTTPTIQATNFVNLGGINLTFLASKDEWVNFYKDVSDFVKNYMGEDYRVLSEVIQFDEITPHLQLMGIYRTEIKLKEEKDIRNDKELFDKVASNKFTRYNGSLKGQDGYTDPKKKKLYKQAKEKWIEENREEIINSYKPRNKKTDMKYCFTTTKTIAAKSNSYQDYQNKLFDFCKEHKFIKNLCQKATEIRGEEVSFVKNSTEKVYDGKSQNHYEIKDTIDRENKEIERKIFNKEELTETEVYRYIRKKNRDKLRKEFLNLDVKSWKEQFNKIQDINFDFNTKIKNDYISLAKEINYKDYIELENERNNIIEDTEKNKNELKEVSKKLENIKQEFSKYENKEKWVSQQYIEKIDKEKELHKKGIFDNTEVVTLKKENYDLVLRMAKDNSSKLTKFKEKVEIQEKEIQKLNEENEKLKQKEQYLVSINDQNESKISYRNKEIEDLKKNNGAMYSKLKYFEKTLNIIKNISSYFPPLRKIIDTIMIKVNTVSYDFDKDKIEKEIKIELEIEKDKKDNWDENKNKNKIKDDWSRY